MPSLSLVTIRGLLDTLGVETTNGLDTTRRETTSECNKRELKGEREEVGIRDDTIG